MLRLTALTLCSIRDQRFGDHSNELVLLLEMLCCCSCST